MNSNIVRKTSSKRNLFFLLTLSMILCIGYSSCKGSKELSAELPERSFIIGSGGGFTGAYDTYKVRSNGKIEQQNADMESYSFLKEIPKDSVLACFKALDALALEEYSFNHPGNMTYFLEINSSTIKWGASDYTIRKDIDTFFKRISTMIRSEYD